MQDLAYCDYYCTPVKFQEPEIFVFVGDTSGFTAVRKPVIHSSKTNYCLSFMAPISCGHFGN